MAALALVGAGVLSAVWYAILAPSNGASVAPGGSALEIAAVQTGTGSWYRYLVTVQNRGDLDVEGDVVLAARSASDPPVSLPSRNWRSYVPPPVGTARLPALTPDAVYQARVVIPAHAQRTLAFLARDGFNQALLAAEDGSVLASAGVERGAGVTVAVLSSRETTATLLQTLTYDFLSLRVTSITQARSLPASPLLLGGFSIVVLDQFETAQLNQRQLEALRDFVGLGGQLLLVGGSTWRATLAPLPAELLPLRPKATTTTSLAAVGELADRSSDLTGSVLSGDVAPGARVVLNSPEGLPLMVEAAYGAGRVVELAFDPAAEPLASARLSALAWSQGLGRLLQPALVRSSPLGTLLEPETVGATLFPPAPPPDLPSLWVVGPALLVYVLLVGPLNYLFIRRRWGRPHLLWVSTPVVVAVFAGSFYAVGLGLQRNLEDRRVQVLRPAAAGQLSVTDYDRLTFGGRGDHRLDVTGPALAAPLTTEFYRAAVAACERCVLSLAGLRPGEERVLPATTPVVLERGIAYGSVRAVGLSSLEPSPIRLDHQLALVQGRIVGTVANHGDRSLRSVSLYLAGADGYRRAVLAAEIKPGQGVAVDAVPENVALADPLLGLRRQPAADLLDSLARSALGRSPQPLLMARVDPLPSRLLVDGAAPAAQAVAVLEQPAGVDSADALLDSFASRRLASSSGDPRSGYLDAYDLYLPRVEGGLTLNTDSALQGLLEVFDWAGGAWTKLPSRVDPKDSNRRLTPIPAGLYPSGLLRVRYREARIGWGAELTLVAG